METRLERCNLKYDDQQRFQIIREYGKGSRCQCQVSYRPLVSFRAMTSSVLIMNGAEHGVRSPTDRCNIFKTREKFKKHTPRCIILSAIMYSASFLQNA